MRLVTAMKARAVLGCGLLLGARLLASAQSFNIDLSTPGFGAPSSALGGAANNPGYWNWVYGGGPFQPVNLGGLDGGATGVHLVATGGLGGSGYYNNHSNIGDIALLLNTFGTVGDENDYHFSGLLPGRYAIYTYAVNPTGVVDDATVTVPGADVPAQTVTGPMPGNRFILGVTHSIHYLTLTGNSFVIEVSGPWPNTDCNGFQIVAVPENGCVVVVAGGLAALLRRRRFRTEPMSAHLSA